MIENKTIIKFKQSYEEIYQIQIKDQEMDTFIFRPIGREEYKQIVVLDLNLGDYQEMICSQCVLYPESYDFSKGNAGIGQVLAHAILDVSGLLPQQANEMLELFRAEMMKMDYQADCMIHEAFPEYSLEEISSWSIKKTMYYLSRAEWILQNLRGCQLTYLSEEEYQQQEAQSAQEARMPSQADELPQRSNSNNLVKQQPNQSNASAQSEEEVLAMLAGAGAKVAPPSSTMDEVKPELNWFSYMDELKGDFD
ncbi:hypothetical protein [Bacillus atrophaeus]|uniref:hypothetical protein n=1 Tax=Bacillus atrophaeus TaxID=1452 RepID=UPI001C11FB59|nr:hypothetical protein [Bacillus atrophaeus]MBU5262126.1 hypothetical protein [Bacillus atrophaeus]